MSDRQVAAGDLYPSSTPWPDSMRPPRLEYPPHSFQAFFPSAQHQQLPSFNEPLYNFAYPNSNPYYVHAAPEVPPLRLVVTDHYRSSSQTLAHAAPLQHPMRCAPNWPQLGSLTQQDTSNANQTSHLSALPQAGPTTSALSSFSSTATEGNNIASRPSPAMTEDIGTSPEPTDSPVSPPPLLDWALPRGGLTLQNQDVPNYVQFPVQSIENDPSWLPYGPTGPSLPPYNLDGIMDNEPKNSYSRPLTFPQAFIGGPYPPAIMPFGFNNTPLTRCPDFPNFGGDVSMFGSSTTQPLMPRCQPIPASGTPISDFAYAQDPMVSQTNFPIPHGPMYALKNHGVASGSTRAMCRPATHNDELLVMLKDKGWSYRQIKKHLNLHEAESTLRGRYRTLTKAKEQRVRRPEWHDVDIRLLQQAVEELRDGNDSSKVSWKNVSQFIFENGGTYKFGASTCKKKWREISHVEETDEDDI